MGKNSICSLLLLVLCLFAFETFFYKIVVLLIGILIYKKRIKELLKWKYSLHLLIALCCVGLWVTSPRLRWNTNDRVRLIYQDKHYNPRNMPIHHYFANLLIPIPEMVNFGLPMVRFNKALTSSIWQTLVPNSGAMPELIKQFIERNADGQSICSSYRGFKSGYKRLEYHGQFLGSGAYSQCFNEFLGENTSAVYVQSPKSWKKDKEYPVVIFLHGYLGNWQNYQGWLLGMDDYVVLSPGTHGLAGVWNKNDIKNILDHQLSFLKKLGYKIDRNRVHVIGLSNGAHYGSSTALRYYKYSFKSITFDVGSNKSGTHHKNEMHIYGIADAACPQHLKKYNEVKSTDDYIYFPCCGHFVHAYHSDEIRQWLLKRWKEIDE